MGRYGSRGSFWEVPSQSIGRGVGWEEGDHVKRESWKRHLKQTGRWPKISRGSKGAGKGLQRSWTTGSRGQTAQARSDRVLFPSHPRASDCAVEGFDEAWK